MKKIQNMTRTVTCLLGTVLIIWFIGSCESKTLTSVDEPELIEPAFPEMSGIEKILENLASALPEVLTDSELAKILYDEVKRNVVNEPYALWRTIADRLNPEGMSMRMRIEQIIMNRSHRKTVFSAGISTSDMDSVDNLQVYVHNFEDWDGLGALSSSFTPLTIDDVDVTELMEYDTLGNSTILDVSDHEWQPDYAIAIVSLNEGMAAQDSGFVLLKTATSATSAIYCEKITVRKPRSLEPWWKGHADMVVAQKSESSTGYIYKVKNPAGQTCGTKKSKTATKYIADGSSTHIKVYEFDLFGFPEWIIEDGLLSFSGGWWTLQILDTGKYYKCGSRVRCSYEFSRL